MIHIIEYSYTYYKVKLDNYLKNNDLEKDSFLSLSLRN